MGLRRGFIGQLASVAAIVIAVIACRIFGGVLTELNLPVTEDQKLWDQIMELTPLKRWMSVEEAAEWIYFMAVKNRFCTGQNILIDGLEAGNCNFIWP